MTIERQVIVVSLVSCNSKDSRVSFLLLTGWSFKPVRFIYEVKLDFNREVLIDFPMDRFFYQDPRWYLK